jgi:hypothetical protein
MNRKTLVFCFVTLFIFAFTVIPDSTFTEYIYSDEEIQTIQDPSLVASAGDISTESIGESYNQKFRDTSISDESIDPNADTNGDAIYTEWRTGESTDDDILYYPDMDTETTYLESYTLKGGGYDIAYDSGAITDTYADDGTCLEFYEASFSNDQDYMILKVNNTNNNPIEGTLTLDIKSRCGLTGYNTYYYLLDADDSIYDLAYTETTSDSSFSTISLTITGKYYSITNKEILIKIMHQASSSTTWEVDIDYVAFTPSISDLGENFAVIDDWIDYSGGVISTDSDVCAVECIGTGADDAEGSYTNTPSFTSVLGYYLEIRYKCVENSGSADLAYLRLFEADDYVTTAYTYTFTIDDNWHTGRVKLGDYPVESLMLVGIVDNTVDMDIFVDYYRIGLASEMGWQDDGSTAQSVIAYTSGYTYTESSDGDILTVTTTYDASSKWGGCKMSFDPDTTTTPIDIERDYYPYIEISIRATWYDGAGSCGIWMQYDGYGKSRAFSGGENNTWVTIRKNIAEATTVRNYKYLWFYGQVDNVGESFTFEIDYTKIYCMQNFTYSTTATNEVQTAIVYYDDTEDAMAFEKYSDSSRDYVRIQTENTSIGYACDGMYIGVTAKVAVNDTAGFRFYVAGSGTDVQEIYQLYDDWMTFWMPLEDVGVVSYIYLYLDDNGISTSSGTWTIYVKNNVTIQPSPFNPYTNFVEDGKAIGDWTANGAAEALTSDGENIVTIAENDDSWDVYYRNDIDIYPYENYWFSMRVQVTSTDCTLFLLLRNNAAGYGGSSNNMVVLYIYPTTTEMTTYRYHILDNTNEGREEYHAQTMAIGLKSTTTATVTYEWINIGGVDATEGLHSESFSNIDEWAWDTSYDEADDSFSTDGSFMMLELDWDGGTDLDWIGCSGLDIPISEKTVVEIRCKVNTTSGDWTLHLEENDHVDGTFQDRWYSALPEYTDWGIVKLTYSDLTQYGTPESPIEAIGFYCRSYSEDIAIYIDYIRISDGDNIGWQYDCSSMYYEYGTVDPYFCDGDSLEVDATDASQAYFGWYSYVKISDYPFIEFKIYSASDAELSFTLLDEDSATVETGLNEPDSQWSIYRYNLQSLVSGDYVDRISFKAGKDNEQKMKLDYVKFYSIANFSCSNWDDESTTTVAYTESSSIMISGIVSDYVRLDYVGSLSVDTSTYNVWNASCSSSSSNFRLRHYVSEWLYEDIGETRDSLPSGTLSEFYFYLYGECTISEIEFYEDNVAPVINNFWTVPYTPDEEDDLTLAVFVAETDFGAYTVTFNAIDYPSGYSDIDYSASESSIQTGLWQVTIPAADIVAGYYAWGVTVDDGANTATDFEVLRVTTIYLQITDIVLITATTELAQVSGHSNKDCSYQIYENNTLQGSGSVTEGWFSISWTKDTTAGTYIELGIKFYVSTYSDWVNGSYSVASAEILQVTNPAISETSTEVQLTGYSSLSCNYYVYSNDTYQSVTGSLTTGSFAITWTKETSVGLHRWGVKFNDSSTIRWVNGSYDVTSTTFLVSDPILSGDSSTVHVTCYSNLAGNYYVYSNDTYQTVSGSFVAGSVEVTWSKSLTVGLHVWGIKFNTSAGTIRWVNGSYDVTSTTFLVSDPVPSENEIEFEVSAFSNLDCTYKVYENESLSESGSLSAGSILVDWPKQTTIGVWVWGIQFNSSGTIRWINGSYDVTATYGTCHIYTYDEGGDYIDWEQFIFLVNGTQIVGNEFYDRTDYSYLIVVQDKFGFTLNTTTHSFARSIRISLQVYSFSVHNMLDDQFIYFELTRFGGGTWSRHIAPTDHILFELYDTAVYTYEYTSVANDGTTRSHSGSVTISADTALVIVDVGLDRIINEILLINPGGGGVSTEYVAQRFNELSSTLTFMWAFLWGFGILMVVLIWVAPYLSKRGVFSGFDSSGKKPQDKKFTTKPKAERSGSGSKPEKGPFVGR